MPLLPLIEGRMQISIESLFYFQPYPCQQPTSRNSEVTGSGKSLEKQIATHSSILAWETHGQRNLVEAKKSEVLEQIKGLKIGFELRCWVWETG